MDFTYADNRSQIYVDNQILEIQILTWGWEEGVLCNKMEACREEACCYLSSRTQADCTEIRFLMTCKCPWRDSGLVKSFDWSKSHN